MLYCLVDDLFYFRYGYIVIQCLLTANLVIQSQHGKFVKYILIFQSICFSKVHKLIV